MQHGLSIKFYAKPVKVDIFSLNVKQLKKIYSMESRP